MNRHEAPGIHKPFERLKELIARNQLKLPDRPHDSYPQAAPPLAADPREDKTLFLEAMVDVIPIEQNKTVALKKNLPHAACRQHDEEAEDLHRLRELIASGKGFVVSQTPEYIEGAAPQSHPDLTRRLHRGDFSIQDFIDLHGMQLPEAKAAFEVFMKRSILSGKKALLVIHGRGLSSPDRPVLKSNMVQWISKSPWRKWIRAYSSARLCDGGAGATYILLRRTPVNKQK